MHGAKRCSTAFVSVRVAVSPDGVTVTKKAPAKRQLPEGSVSILMRMASPSTTRAETADGLSCMVSTSRISTVIVESLASVTDTAASLNTRTSKVSVPSNSGLSTIPT